MISICIPIYNYDVRKLVYSLHKQATELMVPFEILLIDDASEEHYQNENQELAFLSNLIYKKLAQNLGRVGIRNKLAQEAQYRYLIFIDCDAKIYINNYVKRYVEVCSPGIVCVGGNKYTSTPPENKYYLHWLYGSRREALDVHTRNKNPNASFKTFNFLIDKKIFEKIRFDDKLTRYGHEDTLFGIELSKHNIKVIHIDNPLIHAGLESSSAFIKKTEESLNNLIEIYEWYPDKKLLTSSIRLLRTEQLVSKYHLSGCLQVFYRIFSKSILRRLLGKYPKLLYLDLYKLSYYALIKSNLYKNK